MEDEATQFLTMFDCLGFECLINVSEEKEKYDKECDDHTWKILQGDDKAKHPSVNVPLNKMILRARFNEQRNPEIWAFTSTVDEESLNELMETDPQMLANLIRGCGKCLFGYEKQKSVIV
jgi:hypothetical protein